MGSRDETRGYPRSFVGAFERLVRKMPLNTWESHVRRVIVCLFALLFAASAIAEEMLGEAHQARGVIENYVKRQISGHEAIDLSIEKRKRWGVSTSAVEPVSPDGAADFVERISYDGILNIEFDGLHAAEDLFTVLRVLAEEPSVLPAETHSAIRNESPCSIYSSEARIPCGHPGLLKLASDLNEGRDYSKDLLIIGQDLRFPKVRVETESAYRVITPRAIEHARNEGWLKGNKVTELESGSIAVEYEGFTLRAQLSSFAQARDIHERLYEVGVSDMAFNIGHGWLDTAEGSVRQEVKFESPAYSASYRHPAHLRAPVKHWDVCKEGDGI